MGNAGSRRASHARNIPPARSPCDEPLEDDDEVTICRDITLPQSRCSVIYITLGTYIFKQINHRSRTMGVVGTASPARWRYPDSHGRRNAAAASFHGGGLATHRVPTARTLSPVIKARLYFGHAASDKGMPAEPSKSLTGPSKPGEASTKVKSTKAPFIAGPSPTVRSITSPRPSGRLKS